MEIVKEGCELTLVKEKKLKEAPMSKLRRHFERTRGSLGKNAHRRKSLADPDMLVK